MSAIAGSGQVASAQAAGGATSERAAVTKSGRQPNSVEETETEESLMIAYAAGDERAFARLFAALAPQVHRFFYRSFRDRHVCEELLQTTFLRIHRARRDYRSALALRPWIFTIAARIRQDELRRRYRLREDAGEEALAMAEEARAVESARDAGRDDPPGEMVTKVRTAVECLPESQRVVLELHRYQELTFAQIAAILGTSEVAVRGRAFRAYAQLRKQLAPVLDEGTQ